MRIRTIFFGLMMSFASAVTAPAQFPAASEEHKILKMEEGEWDADVTMFMGPAGPYDPPHKSKGKEVNRMIGDFWLDSEFSGDFEGMQLTGQGQFGYDPSKKKYVGTWIDSFSPNVTNMVGTYDAETKTMTYETTGVGMDGGPSTGKNVVVYGDNERTMTMYYAAPGTEEMVKVMELRYTRAQ